MAEMTADSIAEVMDDLWADQKAVKMAVKLVDLLDVMTAVDLGDSMAEKRLTSGLYCWL